MLRRSVISLCLIIFVMLPVVASDKQVRLFDENEFRGNIDGKEVRLYTLRNKNGMVTQISNFGGKVLNLWTPDKSGKFDDVVTGFASFDAFKKARGSYFGALIGRFGNRIAQGKFSLDGVSYQLPLNNGQNSLHGGPKGFHNVVWEARPFKNKNKEDALELKYLSAAGEMGYPGNLSVTVVYTLTRNNALKIEYWATTDQKTVVNLTNHTFFNLHGFSSGVAKSINSHVLQINASKYNPTDETLIPTGEMASVTGTPMDFTKPTPIGERVDQDFSDLKHAKGYDHNWILDKGQHEFIEAAVIYEPSNGRLMTVLTTEPGIQFYGGNFFNGKGTGKYGEVYHHRTAFAMETQHFPDSPNQLDFPSTVLDPGETYYHMCVYHFDVLKSRRSPDAGRQTSVAGRQTSFASLRSTVYGQQNGNYIAANNIDLKDVGTYGLVFSEEQTFHPDKNGILKDHVLILPPYVEGIFTSNGGFLNTSIVPSHINRALPWYFRSDTYANLFNSKNNPNAVFLMIKLTDGRSMALLPMANPLSVCYIYADAEKGFLLRHATYGTESITGKVPLLAWAVADTPVEASYRLFEKLSEDKSIAKTFRLRSEKSYSEPYKYLGWCSWEEYRTNINEALLVKAAQDLKKSEVPVRFMLIDDGHQDRTEIKENKKNKRTLTSFNTDPELFPDGYGKILAERDTTSLKWFGLWLNMHGYWQGFTKENNGFGELNDCLREVPSTGLYMPKNDKDKIVRLYEHYFEPSVNAGFDFLKIDWQTSGMMMTNGAENPAQQAWLTSRSVDSIATRNYPYTTMNCMAQNNVVLLNTLNVNSTRTSIDYKLNDLPKAKQHILQSFQNAVYMGPTVWGDHDMFHSSDSICGELMALSKAISGGPVYLSDAPDKIVLGNVMPLCFSDGRLLRPLAPGTTLPKSYYTSPLDVPELFFVAAPLKNDAVSIVAYNLYDKPVTLESTINTNDYKDASAIIQGLDKKWKVPVEGLLAFNYFEQTGSVLKDEIPVKVKDFNHCYYQLSPIHNGWSVIGATQKYLCSEAIENIRYAPEILTFDLIEGGEFAIYLAEGKPVAGNIAFVSLGNGLWKGEVDQVKYGQRVKINIRKK